MITTMDKAGRVVVPKAMRKALGLLDGGEVELDIDDDGRLVMSARDVPKHLEIIDGLPVVVADGDMPPLTQDMVRATLESIRR